MTNNNEFDDAIDAAKEAILKKIASLEAIVREGEEARDELRRMMGELEADRLYDVLSGIKLSRENREILAEQRPGNWFTREILSAVRDDE